MILKLKKIKKTLKRDSSRISQSENPTDEPEDKMCQHYKGGLKRKDKKTEENKRYLMKNRRRII